MRYSLEEALGSQSYVCYISRVTFPQTLNLNSFINATDVETFGANHSQTNGFISSASSEHDNTESLTKCDDSSTTDSGAAMEEDNCSGIATTASSSHNDNDLQVGLF